MTGEKWQHLGRVIGGTDASQGQYPFAVFLMVDEGDQTAFCGGTILSDQWILTAGHCVVDTSSRGNSMNVTHRAMPSTASNQNQDLHMHHGHHHKHHGHHKHKHKHEHEHEHKHGYKESEVDSSEYVPPTYQPSDTYDYEDDSQYDDAEPEYPEDDYSEDESSEIDPPQNDIPQNAPPVRDGTPENIGRRVNITTTTRKTNSPPSNRKALVRDQNWPSFSSLQGRKYPTVKAKNIVVGVGSIYNTRASPHRVSQVHVHPDLNLDYFDNDIALLKLKKKIKFNSNTQPILIDTGTIDDGLMVTGIGWGKTSLGSQDTSPVLQVVDLTIGNEPLCQRIRPEFTGNDGNYICVTTPDGRDTCSGDSGGPLLRRCSGTPGDTGSAGSGPWVQLGITSYGDNSQSTDDTVCAATNGAGFYTHVANYLGFISKTTGISRDKLTATCNGSQVSRPRDANNAGSMAIGSKGFWNLALLAFGTAALIVY
ncbi:Testisin [Coemansia sp. Benny D115]|nr:Testisin [Coemansia sp. Benny D115]